MSNCEKLCNKIILSSAKDVISHLNEYNIIQYNRSIYPQKQIWKYLTKFLNFF